MKYCKKCVLPDTRPGIMIGDEGICNACTGFDHKNENVRWDEREQAFKKIVESAIARKKDYDCLIPVSGGKDSTWQVLKCLKYGLKPLAVTWKTPVRTELGQKNLNNLVSLGVDHIDYQINPKVEKKFLYKALERFGAVAIPMHMAMFNIPSTLAVRLDIPLIIWGENSAEEYGTYDEGLKGFEMNDRWFRNFGVTNGTTAKDWICDDLTEKEMTPYFSPDSSELKERNIKAIFLGHFFKWDVEITLKSALDNGFKVREEGPMMGYYNYADIDDEFMPIHHYLKWYKFGITRLFDNLSLEIRNGRMSRKKALNILKEKGDQKPIDAIKVLCDFIDISEDSFYKIIEKFRNENIWIKEKSVWKIKNFIIQDWEWKHEN
jgi:N-acetyl sugar amidotransferase